ncbi:hypothetical protein EW146_g3078 [Bondarzewia mesenterica]|uniref:N-terminal of MaoC-like dehydratase domain-containing protein n=1 Tax=Bondarzewia mesenterica TaxID=1095465 RepID=A0A4V3XFK1_9AGAM|nr:hypothetical protein EW146_g3078 [Bondarzewia mesenterica]
MLRQIRSFISTVHRRHYSAPPSWNVEALDRWISQEKQLVLSDRFHTEHLSDLYVTLPTRDGTRAPYVAPEEGARLGYGHHLAFFHPRTPEKDLRPDGTDADFCPPAPFVRRMWAGGKIEWRKPLIVGKKATSVSTVASVAKKGFEKGSPMVFVKQNMEVKHFGEDDIAVFEERSHVYLALGVDKRTTRAVEGLPTPDFSLTYTPSATTLFRFSALTFNGHHIHLDRDYAQSLKDILRLVHGPLTALMLLETLIFHKPDAQPKSFEYRALNPVVVNRSVTIHGSLGQDGVAQLWTEDADGVVGMRGTVLL